MHFTSASCRLLIRQSTLVMKVAVSKALSFNKKKTGLQCHTNNLSCTAFTTVCLSLNHFGKQVYIIP